MNSENRCLFLSIIGPTSPTFLLLSALLSRKSRDAETSTTGSTNKTVCCEYVFILNLMPARRFKQVGTGSTKDWESRVILKNMDVYKKVPLLVGLLDADWLPYKYKVLLQCAVSVTFVRFTRVSAPAVSEFVVLSSPS